MGGQGFQPGRKPSTLVALFASSLCMSDTLETRPKYCSSGLHQFGLYYLFRIRISRSPSHLARRAIRVGSDYALHFNCLVIELQSPAMPSGHHHESHHCSTLDASLNSSEGWVWLSLLYLKVFSFVRISSSNRADRPPSLGTHIRLHHSRIKMRVINLNKHSLYSNYLPKRKIYHLSLPHLPQPSHSSPH